MEIDDLTCISIASHFQSQVVINSLKEMEVLTLVLMATGVYILPSRIEVGTVIFKFTSPPIQSYLFNMIFGRITAVCSSITSRINKSDDTHKKRLVLTSLSPNYDINNEQRRAWIVQNSCMIVVSSTGKVFFSLLRNTLSKVLAFTTTI